MSRAFIYWVARRALRWFYRAHRVVIEGGVPDTGAVLLIGNHPNDLPDVLMGYLCTDRPVRYLATVSVTEAWVARKTYEALDVIPVVRVRDARKLRQSGVDLAAINRGASESVVEALCRGEVIGAFPQGGVHDTPGIGRIRTGVSQMLLEYIDNGVSNDVQIVAFGVHYDAPSEPGSDVVCHVGRSFSLRAWYDAHPHNRDVSALTERIRLALLSVARSATCWEEAERRDRLVAAWSAAASPDPLAVAPSFTKEAQRVAVRGSGEAPEQETVRLGTVAKALSDAVEEAGGRGTSAVDHGLLRKALGLSSAVKPASIAVTVLQAPVAVLGAMLHVLPWRVVLSMARKLSRERSDFAARCMVPGFFVLFAWYLLLSIAPLPFVPVGFWAGWLVMVWGLVPRLGDVALSWWRAVRSRAFVAAVRRFPAERRNALREMAASLTLPGSPPAES